MIQNQMGNRVLSTQAHIFLTKMQRNELTEYYVYTNIAKTVKDTHNSDVLKRIAAEEKKHYHIWEAITGEKIKPSKLRIFWFTFLARIFGYTFALKLMENNEGWAAADYEAVVFELPEAQKIAEEENRHEQELLSILDEERLQYLGSMVLGLSDALVELTGTLAGLTFALQNNRLVALSGLITGISATLSMTSSEYLSARSEGHKNPLKSSLYTGFVYLLTVACLVLPYLLLPAQAFWPALMLLLLIVLLIIVVFTYYISVAKGLSFKHRFIEMAGISLAVAAFSFVLGLFVKRFLGLEI